MSRRKAGQSKVLFAEKGLQRGGMDQAFSHHSGSLPTIDSIAFVLRMAKQEDIEAALRLATLLSQNIYQACELKTLSN